MVNVVLAQLEKDGKDFETMVSYLGKVITKGYYVQSIQIAKTGSKPPKPKVASSMGKIECKKHLKTV